MSSNIDVGHIVKQAVIEDLINKLGKAGGPNYFELHSADGGFGVVRMVDLNELRDWLRKEHHLPA